MGKLSFRHLSVKGKLSLGFGLVLLLTALVGLIGYNGIDATIERVDKADDTNRMIKLRQDARMSEKNYIARNDDAEVVEFNGFIAAVLSQAEDLKRRFNDQQNIELMQTLIEQTSQYQVEFKRYVAIEEEREAIIEQMRSRAQAVLDLLDQMRAMLNQELDREFDSQGSLQVIRRDLNLAEDAGSVSRWMLEARSAEKNFLTFGGQEHAQAGQQEIDRIRSKLSQMDSEIANQSRSELIQQAMAAIAAYDTAFERFIELNSEGETAKLNMIEEAQEAIGSAEAGRADQKNQMLAISENTKLNTLLLPVVAIIIGVSFAWLITASIVPPLRRAAQAASDVAEGKLAIDIPLGARDEPGIVLNSLRDMVSGLRDLVGNMQSSADEVAASADQLSAVTVQTSEGVQSQKMEVDQVASAMHEMLASIQEVANNAEKASGAAQESDDTTRNGEQLVNTSQESIQALAQDIQASSRIISEVREKSANVSTVLDVIKNIAEQTNLLALNAAGLRLRGPVSRAVALRW